MKYINQSILIPQILIIQIKTIFQLRITSSGVRYYMHYDVYSGLLYVSLPNEKLVIKILPNDDKNFNSPTKNIINEKYEIVAGIIGKTCIGNKRCGDGGLAVNALLAYPKVHLFLCKL